MPENVKAALRRVAARFLRRHGKKTTEENRAGFVYGTMTNMQKRGEIKPWRKLK